MTDFQNEIDTRNESCPMPVMKTSKMLKKMSAGATLHVIATDPASVQDIAALTETTGDRIIDQSVVDGEYHFYITKA